MEEHKMWFAKIWFNNLKQKKKWGNPAKLLKLPSSAVLKYDLKCLGKLRKLCKK